MNNFKSLVWERINWFSNRAGLLTLSDGALIFETDHGVHFRCPVAHLGDVAWPWYSFDRSVNLVASGSKYRFTFVRPNGGIPPWKGLAAQNVSDFGSPMKTGKAWKAELARQRNGTV